MATWRLMSGVHQDKDAIPIELAVKPGIERHTIDEWDPKDCYYPGDTFESDKVLERHNVAGQPPKFEKLAEAPDGLDSLTVEKLRQLAIDEEMDIPSGLPKPKLIQAIRGYKQVADAIA